MSPKSYMHPGFGPDFFKAVAVCSGLSALTTLGLIFLPRTYAAPAGLEEEVALRLNGFYQLRSLVYYVHPFLVLTAAWGVVARKFRESTGAVTTGFLFFGCWGFAEALQQALSLVALNLNWREGYARTADEATREMFRTHLLGFEAVWDALYLLLLTGFAMAHILYGIATWPGSGLERVISWGFFLGAGLTLLILSANFGGPAVPRGLTMWLYPTIQPLFRVLLGIWLWPQKGAKTYL
ncbi:MAG: hypothetical protein AVDCRST_MAG56-6210 [uncultured Cytophagales bacterium]|uniref:DUF4386 domain-containing protein n=1 Tax=uncultured Cytophagales bacterium TaxID=158755 RepID=A0A6J4KNM9_9SPHI|nr:MAG: hypothetical protein AVDCRST_MAG56-6210 [uncultured Cytophagales bacterium]